MTTEPFANPRAPALAIVARGDQIESVAPITYMVRSQSHPDTKYRVHASHDRWTCECGFYTETKKNCIHILAVRFQEGFRQGEPAPNVKPECAKCGSGDVIGRGVRRNQSGSVARYECKTCGARFTGKDGFKRRRSDPEKIALALDLYFRGMSLRKVAEHFRQVHNLKISWTTIYEWVTTYGKIAAGWMDAQGAATGDRWHIDETVVSIDGNKSWIWNVLDHDTRFLLATHVSHSRTMTDTRATLHKAKLAALNKPTEIFSDGMPAYPHAIQREFGHGPSSPHVRVPSIRAPESNNLVERLHGTEKERIKVMRGFDTERGTSAIIEGFRVHYNMVRDHQTLGTTPGVAAGILRSPDSAGPSILRMATARPDPTPTVEVVTRPDAEHA